MSGAIRQELPGGLGAVKGLQVSGISAGFRANPNRRDLALIVAAPGSRAAGVFTQSNFAAAPVLLSKEHLRAQAQSHIQPQELSHELTQAQMPAQAQALGQDQANVQGQTPAQGLGFRALIINSGNANAATGSPGLKIAKQSSKIVAQALSCSPEEVLMASTGVIGVQLALEHFDTGIPQAIKELGAGEGQSISQGIACAEAIMTTDTVHKTSARSFVVAQPDGSEATCTVGGMAKGSGMIAPHMATMIAVLATDALLEQEDLQQALEAAVDVSFNKVTIDSDTSTNDSAYLIATGAALGEPLKAASPAHEAFVAALVEVCQDLAYQIARDGEGATKVIVVDVEGAATATDANLVARAIADSPLVKTAVAGHDANWGRIAMAAGKAGASFKQEDVDISIMGLKVLKRGMPLEFSEDEALKRFEQRDEVHIIVDLRAGNASTRIWTCDLTKEYIAINGDYRS